MLKSLLIRNLAIIDALDLEFSNGFTALTGETGAGKSILIDALGLIVGARADATLVRSGCEKAEVSAEFELPAAAPALLWLREHELDDDGACLVRRLVQSDGRTRAYVNGRPVAAGDLRALGEHLVEIFGQGESQTLLRSDVQRERLDDYGGLTAPRAAVAAAAARLRSIDNDIARLRQAQSHDPAQLDFLRFQLGELLALGLSADELESLDLEHRQLANAGRLIGDGNGAQQLLYGGDQSIYDQLAAAAGVLQELGELDSGFADAATLVLSAQEQVREAADALRHRLERLDLDPQRLVEVENRLAAIHDLARKHRVRADALPQRQVELQAQLDLLEHAGSELAHLHEVRDVALQDYRQAAARLGAARRDCAPALADAVSRHVRELGMPNAQFSVAVETTPDAEPSSFGDELVRFDFSANPGQPPRALAKVASGGELSRVSLAVQVSLHQHGGAATMIFDEVDAGIGGSVAATVGAQLAALGAERQVLCVTHLAQVAAKGRQHFSIRKEVRDGQTRTQVSPLDKSSRVAELARMLGGEQITPATTALARDLLKQN